MCGIILSEEKIPSILIELVSNRGKDFTKIMDLEDSSLFSSVLFIRSTVEQPIVEPDFILQYNGEIYNNSNSDTIYIKEQISKNINSNCSENINECFEFLTKVYLSISKFENELALCIKIGRFVCFFKDDIGRKSLGYSLEPFILSSLLYSFEIDSMKLYIYDLRTKIVHNGFKPKQKIVSEFLNRLNSIKIYLNSQKYQKEISYLSEYQNNAIVAPDYKSFDIEYQTQDFKLTEELHNLLLNSFYKRMYNDSVVVFLSGGIDSLIVAIYTHLTLDEKKTIYLINTALPNSFDREMGIQAYNDLSNMYPKRKFVFIKNDLSLELIREHKNIIEKLLLPKTDRMNFNILCILYFSGMIASKYSKIVYLGSGADELFGGYNKYKVENFRDHMLFDLFTISSHNLCRDDRAVSNWNLEARFPLLDTDVAIFSLKISSSGLINNSHNKIPLRQILKFHRFDRASETPKKAMQFGTGMKIIEDYIYQ